MFSFKQFDVDDTHCGMKVGTDGVLLGAWADPSRARTILDAGTGSGLIALMLAQRAPQASITAIDCSADACHDAAANARLSPFSDRIKVLESDYNTFKAPAGGFDLIISNPPFFTEHLHSPSASRASARHEAAFGVESLISRSRDILAENGEIAFIAPSSRTADIELLIEINRFHLIRRCEVRSVDSKPPYRTLWQLAISPLTPPEKSSLSIRDSSGKFTTEYQSLTSDFYL
ncbi:MAG: methyltransferase [Lachnoclostridium sp.]|nr:methyltransferase [Lachnoclostridium sp.]